MSEIKLQIPPLVHPKDYQVGVIVCRMQVPYLHDAHKHLIDTVCGYHNKVVIFLGVPRVTQTEKNPLDFTTRKLMIQDEYPNITILPLRDQREDSLWSYILDDQLSMAYDGTPSFLLYGSRDSFIPYYKGKFQTVELISSHEELSGTELRNLTANQQLTTSEARKGAIYQAYGRRPITYPTVDVVAYNDKGELLLGKKPNESKWRFIGGFVDPTDANWEQAAQREFREETGGSANISDLRYVASARINDWRYQGEKDSIMTTLFMGKWIFGRAEASDDIVDLSWISVDKLRKEYKDLIMAEHVELFGKLIEYIDKSQIITI